MKTRNDGRKAAQKQLIGVATVCKRLIPKLKAWLSSEDHFGSLNHQPLYQAMSVFNATLPPLAGNMVAVAALATLPGRGDDLLEIAGDFWIGLAELLQVVRNRDLEELMPRVSNADVRTGLRCCTRLCVHLAGARLSARCFY